MKGGLEKLYGVWAASVVVPTAVLGTTVFGSTAIVAGLKHHELSSACGRNWARTLLAANFSTVSVHGGEGLDGNRSYVVMANHQSYFDTLALLGHLPLPIRFVMKKELGKIPIFGAAVKRPGGILVDRSDRGQAIEELRKGILPLVQRNLSLLVFPEGTRSKSGQLGPFKKGGFMTAISTGLPILPVGIRGSERCLPAQGWKLRPGTMELHVGTPIEVSAFGVERREELMGEVRRQMLALSGRTDSVVQGQP